MISHLRALIAAAIKEIEELEIKIKKAEEELEKCYQLKPILSRINSNALNGYNALQRAGNSLNAGIKIGGVGQGEKILERSTSIQKLSSNAEAGASNVQNRIEKLEHDIEAWNARIAQLRANISSWEAEIARLEAEAAARAAAEEAAKRRKR